MAEIGKLAGEHDAAEVNQCVRWIQNKDDHATQLQHIVTQYFMTQRIKPAKDGDEAAQKKYVHELSCLHRMLISAMKCKQTLDAQHVADLRGQIDAFAASYLSEGDLKHIQEHHKGK